MNLTQTVAGVFILISAACGTANDSQTIGKNVSPSADLADVKTFSWTSTIDNIPSDKVFIGPTGVYVFNNESARERIKAAVEYELDSRGYKIQQGSADVLVSFFILEHADSLATVDGKVSIPGTDPTAGDVSLTPVQPGTLIINLTDNKTSQLIWQGFASGILKPEDLNDESKIRQAVSSIFSQFNHDNI